MIGYQEYRSVADIRGAFLGQKAKLAALPNAELIDYRNRLGLTQRGMAARFGITQQMISLAEAGKRPVPAAIRIAMKGGAA